MATLTVDRFLDAAAVTAGETFTMNGARLTIRTDTRVHANAPATMTGALGSLAISSTLGGGITLDGTKVRWMPFNTGAGTVPAIGTSITRGGATGILLGVWATITSAPTAVGAAMPTTGFIKFREVTGGPFTAGALTGISASATGPDVVGWIEVVLDQAAAITVPRLGDFTVRGSWYDLGTTTGVANQLVSIPTNGSATCYTPGVWIANIATPLTDDDWDFYPSVYAAGLIAANFGTDLRSRVVCMETNGQIRIGHNGTVAIGFLPPAGRQIRIGNVFGRQCTAAARAANVIPSATATTRPDFVTTSAGAIDMERFVTDWYLNFAQPFSVRVRNFATFEYLTMSEVASPIDIYDGGIGLSQAMAALPFDVLSCFAGGTVTKMFALRQASGAAGHVCQINASSGITLSRVEAGVATFARTNTAYAFNIVSSSGIILNNCKQFNAAIMFATSDNCSVTNLDHSDRFVGATNTTTPIYAINTSAKASKITVNGLTFGLGGTIANCHPNSGLIFCALSSDIKFRNVGTRSAISAGGLNPPLFVFVSGGNNQRIKIQRVYLQPTGTGAISTLNSDKGNVYEHVYGDFADAMQTADLNGKFKNCAATPGITGQASVYGTMFYDAFVSDTVGRVLLAMNEKTTETAAYQTIIAGTPQFTSAGNLVLNDVSDEVHWEMDYFVLGCTALANVVPTVTGTNVTFSAGSRWGNHDLFYQIDKGAGFGGTWIAFNQTNLALETGINPAVGFKIKFRAVCAIAATTNLLTFVRFDTVTTLASQSANLYPLDTAAVSVSGLVSGSRVKASKVSDGAILFNGAESGGAISFQTDFVGAINLEARKASAAPFYQPWVTQVTTVADQTATATALQVLDQ